MVCKERKTKHRTEAKGIHRTMRKPRARWTKTVTWHTQEQPFQTGAEGRTGKTGLRHTSQTQFAEGVGKSG